MSADEKANRAHPLKFIIPQNNTPSSVDSSLNPSPITTAESPPLTRSHLSSSSTTATLSVRFAPLPQLAPRKKRYGAPLGVAHRSRLMRRRRVEYDENGEPIVHPTPLWADDELNSPRDPKGNDGEADEIGEDPLAALGKLVRVASKKVWRSVSQNSSKPPRAVVMVTGVKKESDVSAPTGTKQEGEGGVWEEEVSEEFQRTVSQTETIRDGRQLAWLGAVEVASPVSPSPTNEIVKPDASVAGENDSGKGTLRTEMLSATSF